MSPPRIVVVGAGHLGGYHISKVAQLQGEGLATLAGVVDIDAGARQRVAAEYDVAVAEHIDQLEGPIDGAIVAAPTSDHLALAEQIIGRGWHLLVEKPIAASVAEGERMVALAAERGVVLQVGHTERFNPAVAAALAIADRPRYIVTERLGPFSGRSTDIDVVLDLMIHDLDIVGALIPCELAEVRAIGVPILTHAIDMAAVRLTFADGSVAQLAAGRASMEPSRKIRLFTVERYVSIDCASREVKSVRRLPADPNSNWPQIAGEPVEVSDEDALFAQDRDFVRCIVEQATPRVDGVAGLRALQLAEAVLDEMSVPIPDPPQ